MTSYLTLAKDLYTKTLAVKTEREAELKRIEHAKKRVSLIYRLQVQADQGEFSLTVFDSEMDEKIGAEILAAGYRTSGKGGSHAITISWRIE